MVEIVLSGDLETLLQQSLQIKAISEFRKLSGWALFQDDEEWVYEIQMDEKVCEVCRNYGFIRNFRGSDIPIEFPDREVSDSKTELSPRVHKRRYWLKGICRCWMWWRDVGFTLAERLGRELISAIK